MAQYLWIWCFTVIIATTVDCATARRLSDSGNNGDSRREKRSPEPAILSEQMQPLVHPLVALRRGGLTSFVSRRSPVLPPLGVVTYDESVDGGDMQPVQQPGVGASLGKDQEPNGRFTPYVSVGALSNMRQFFDDLRANLDSIEAQRHLEDEMYEDEEKLGDEETAADEEHNRSTGGKHKSKHNKQKGGGGRRVYANGLPHLFGVGGPPVGGGSGRHHMSSNLRNFVSSGDPGDMRRANNYDPAWLWTGLGRR